MKELRDNIAAAALRIVEPQGAYLVDVTLKQERRDKVVQVLVDTDEGITIERCALISRELGLVLDGIEALSGSYRLEVSSPGIDKPLKLLRQYPKNIGRPFRVRFRGGSGEESLAGTLTAVDGDELTFSPDEGPHVRVRFGEIIECKEQLPW